MDLEQNELCKEMLRRLPPELLGRLRTMRTVTRANSQNSSSSEEEDESDDPVEVQKIALRLISTPTSDCTEDSDNFVLLTEPLPPQSLRTTREKGSERADDSEPNALPDAPIHAAKRQKVTKKCKRNKRRSLFCPTTSDNEWNLPKSDIEHHHSDGECSRAYNCSSRRILESSDSARTLLMAHRRSTDSSSSDMTEKNLKLSSDEFRNNCLSVMDYENEAALSNILANPKFDPLTPTALIIRKIITLAELCQREDNVIHVDIDLQRLQEITTTREDGTKTCRLNPFTDVLDIVVSHPDDEFFTFCLCEGCDQYRELVHHIIVEQFKSMRMVLMLLDVLFKAYGPMLKNVLAYKTFKKLISDNKDIYWITCCVIYHNKGEHVDLIYDEYLSDNMIFVLFSSILMLNNPFLLLQILAFHVECIVKAYAEGFLEIVDPDQTKIPANEMINYVLNGYEDLMRISEQVASYLFAFENNFLRKFSLTWKLLCQRLYQQHLHLHLADTMLACIITLKEEEQTSQLTDLIRRYIQFDDIMYYVGKRWTDVWIELNKFNLSEVERKRRSTLLDVHRLFDTLVQDSIAFGLQDSVDGKFFYEFRSMKNRRVAWKKMIYFTKMKWSLDFNKPPNTLVLDDKCKNCNVSLDYHVESCKCITCSIAGGPLPPRRIAEGKCSKCLAQEIVGKDVNFYDSKIVNVCTSDDFQSVAKNNYIAKRHNVGQEYSNLTSMDEILNDNVMPWTSNHTTYHISWAVFSHLSSRKLFPHSTIEEQHFCKDCKLAPCQLARKILRNEISASLSRDLLRYYQPMSMSREELRSVLRKLGASNNGLFVIDVHDSVVKIYWIFIISVYATYFIDFGGCEDGREMPLNLEALELTNNDISINVDKIVGNKDDRNFVEFLDKIKSISPYNKDEDSKIDASFNIDSAKVQLELNDTPKVEDNQVLPTSCETLPPPAAASLEDRNCQEEQNAVATVETQPKKTCKDKTKKCCAEHPEIGEHCKENHSSKKRLRKDCNHARMNETRDRLRKKLSQIVSARKNAKPTQTAAPTPDTQNHLENVAKSKEMELLQEFDDIPRSIVATFEKLHQANKSENFQDFCECLQYLHASQKGDTAKLVNKMTQNKTFCQWVQEHPPVEPPSKKQNRSNSSTRDVSVSSQGTRECDANSANPPNVSMEAEESNSYPDTAPTTATAGKITAGSPTSKASNNLDYLIEICEIIDNYSKERAKRKWVEETLSFIEGPSEAGGKKKSQPQTSNPKKAAKKAKQKQRKEEERRINELKDLRCQFHNIYFKEFAEKHHLKNLKSSKRRDKKRVTELESNIKNLQRAKAKVEAAILELIATVKQTNVEFKFSYLPTKEQQLEKLRELEFPIPSAREAVGNDNNDEPVPSPSFTSPQTNALNMAPETYSMPYVHANHFPYNLSFQPPVAPVPFGLMHASPMCYAPPPPTVLATSGAHHHQSVGPGVVTSMATDSSGTCTSDPSKRIVTIRRVNLPNVPEPQVTVTAKGDSPDKDKLLYTFINGQLVPTGLSSSMSPSSSSSVPLLAPAQATISPEHLLSIPPPPPPPPMLSKTQLKKERRRVAKLQAETDARAEAEQQRVEEEQQRLRDLEELQRQKKHQSQKKKKKPATQPANQKGEAGSNPNRNEVQPKLKQINLTSSNSTTSISTNENNESSPRLTYMKSKHIAVKPQTRSMSTTTSCSAATVSSSNNSISSQVNTRDNSVSSHKPANPKTTNCKKQTKERQTNCGPTITNKLKSSASKAATNSSKKTYQPTSSTLTSEEELEEDSKASKSRVVAKNADKIKTNNETCRQLVVKETTAMSTATEGYCDDQKKKNQSSQQTKATKKRRPKLVDSGQFDNNPFKSLHMQDSDTESYSSEEDENDAVTDVKALTINAVMGLRCSPTETKYQTQQASLKAPSGTNSHSHKDSMSLLEKEKKNSSKQKTHKGSGNKFSKTEQQSLPSKTPEVEDDCTKKLTKQRTIKVASSSTAGASNRKNKTDPRPNIYNTTQVGVSSPHSASHISATKTQSRSNKNHTQNLAVGSHIVPDGSCGTGDSKIKRSQRNKKYPAKCLKSPQPNCCGGIPSSMGYFDPHEATVVSSINDQATPRQTRPYLSLADQMQALRLSDAQYTQQQRHSHMTGNNVSIMDQLSRGVQVENLSLPPGITLTKVDPIKSEQLRQKSESIKKLAKPLQPAQHAGPSAFHHSSMSTTIIAPPVTAMANYYTSPYVAAGNGMGAGAALGPHNGVIMVEANPPKAQNNPAMPATSCSKKSLKNKKRRNKSKANANAVCPSVGKGSSVNQQDAMTPEVNSQPKMITLRNPMFHAMPPANPAPVIQQPPSQIGGRPADGYAINSTPLPVDQPAAIIKNENGMYTIRNPALHQAVTNGLALGGYRQFGNVNYYTPQEAAAEAAKATMLQRKQTHQLSQGKSAAPSVENPSFSYFSNDTGQNGSPHNNISISCTSVEDATTDSEPGQSRGGLSGDAAVIQRPARNPKCISAIGSEIKSAQQQKQRNQEQHWLNYPVEGLPLSKLNNRKDLSAMCGSGFLSAVAEGSSSVGDTNLQEKYQQSKYYNGFDVFASNVGSGSSTATHMHHSCGDDSPPPTITGYNSYLEGIPNTGVIRYDDASFLKNLIPGRNLNNEVSIHNVNDSNFVRNANSPQAHRVEITPVFGGNRPTSTGTFEPNTGQVSYRSHFRDQMGDFSRDCALFSNLSLNELDSSSKFDFKPKPSATSAPNSDTHSSILDLNDILNSKSGAVEVKRHSSSPYLDDNALEGFVQNLNSMHISTATSAGEEHSSQLNGNSNSIGRPVATSANSPSNGWW